MCSTFMAKLARLRCTFHKERERKKELVSIIREIKNCQKTSTGKAIEQNHRTYTGVRGSSLLGLATKPNIVGGGLSGDGMGSTFSIPKASSPGICNGDVNGASTGPVRDWATKVLRKDEKIRRNKKML